MATNKVTAPATTTEEAPAVKKTLAPVKKELMKLSEAFKLISQVLVNNDPVDLSEQMIEAIRDIVSATGYASEYQAPEAE
jgi:hypothetical protein